MSHFVVVVIGDNIENQLAPYQENNMGDCPKELLSFEDLTEEVVEGWNDLPLTTLADVGEEEVKEYPTIDDYAKDYHGYEKNDEGKYGYWTNPNSHWDWWEVGGRWGGYFPVKEEAANDYAPVTRPAAKFRDPDVVMPNKANQLYIEDLDLECAYREAEERGRKEFGEWKEIFTKCGKPRGWQSILADNSFATIDDKRAYYGNQLAIAKAKEDHFSFSCPADDFGFDEEAYVERCKSSVLVPFAVVKDGEWHAKGEMGWFGMSDDDVGQEEWNKEFHKLLTDLPPGTLLTAVDCHV